MPVPKLVPDLLRHGALSAARDTRHYLMAERFAAKNVN